MSASILTSVSNQVMNHISSAGRVVRETLDVSSVTAMHVIAASILIVAVCMLINTVIGVADWRAARAAAAEKKSSRRSGHQKAEEMEKKDEDEDEDGEEKRRPVTRSARGTGTAKRT